MSRNAAISVAVFVVLLVLVVATREEKVSVGMRSLSLPTVTADAAKKIELSGSKAAVLVKDGATWTVSDPAKPDKKFAVEKSALESALSALAELEAGSFVTARAAKHEELDLTEEKALHVRVEQEGGPPLDVLFGRMAKGGGNYLRLLGEDEVFIGKGRFASLVGKDVAAWRKRKLVDQKADELVSVEVTPPGGAAYSVVAKTEGEGEEAKVTWGLADGTALPAGFRADEALVGRIASSMANLRAADFVDDGSAKGLGSAPTGGRAVARTLAGETIAVSFGDEEDKKIYAKLDGDEQVYRVSVYAVNNLMKSLEELRDLTLARFDAASVERVVIKGEKETVDVQKKDGTWTLVAPATTPTGYEFDPGQVDAKLNALARVKAKKRYETPTSETGLDKPTVVVTLTLAGGAEKRIAFGGAVPPEDGRTNEFWVMGAEENVPYAIGKFQRDRYAKPLDLFKKVAAPPGGGMPGGGRAMQGLDQLPPEIRKQLEAQMRAQGGPPGR